jgi:hypothetical protein
MLDDELKQQILSLARQPADLLRSMPDISRTTTATPLSELSELSQLDRRRPTPSGALRCARGTVQSRSP